MAEKMRVHLLAKELNVPSKVIIEKCKAEGITSVKNHMSTLSAGLHATISEWFSEGSHDTTVETATRVDLKKVLKKRSTKRSTTESVDDNNGVGESAVAVSDAPPVSAPAEDRAPAAEGLERPPDVQANAFNAALATPVDRVTTTPSAPDASPRAEEETKHEVTAEAPPELGDVRPATPPVAPAPEEKPEPPVPVQPAGPQNVPAKAKLQGPRVVRYESPDFDIRRRPSPVSRPAGPTAETPAGPPPPGRETQRRKGRINPRRAGGRLADSGERLAEWRDRDLVERRERLAGATGRRIRRRASQPASSSLSATPTRKTVVTVSEPVRMKEFCSATGLNFMECFKVLRDDHNLQANVNMTLPTETAQLLALHFGIELKVIPARTKLDEIREEVSQRERKHLQPRPPVVTMLGHVDHGKTSLLDVIRKTQVVSGEDGGITQHIGAYHIESSHGPVTFLDTPGHKAFTAMRARGAQLTDVVVLVVAADDGLMPQTIEAINHAKAAGVPIVVALNKIDLGDQNKVKIYTQLASHELTPSGDWGGEVDVLETSALTGQGVQELVDHLADLSNLLELRADPTLPAMGSVIEAETKPGVGAVVRVLVQEGTLRVGDFVTCGSAYGKVRALLDDRGKRIQAATPSLPVEVWGIDDVPLAGDMLYVVENAHRAKEIATETKETRITEARLQSTKVRTLEDMVKRRDSADVPVLNLIVKADVDGSVSALKQSLSTLPTDEVNLSIRHAGVGAVTDSDVLLAAASEGLILAFRVDASVRVRRLAEKHGVDIRNYRVIYDATDDVKKALEGLLEPDRLVQARGSAIVKEMFRFGKKIGVVTGCYVTEGVLNRNHFAKIVRNDVVVREGCRYASLRRFKDDVKEVHAGLECGVKLVGFDDIHVGDILEDYEIVEVARTL